MFHQNMPLKKNGQCIVHRLKVTHGVRLVVAAHLPYGREQRSSARERARRSCAVRMGNIYAGREVVGERFTTRQTCCDPSWRFGVHCVLRGASKRVLKEDRDSARNLYGLGNSFLMSSTKSSWRCHEGRSVQKRLARFQRIKQANAGII